MHQDSSIEFYGIVWGLATQSVDEHNGSPFNALLILHLFVTVCINLFLSVLKSTGYESRVLYF